jgi:outer membrane protein TolC
VGVKRQSTRAARRASKLVRSSAALVAWLILSWGFGARAEAGALTLADVIARAQQDPPRVLSALAALARRRAESHLAEGAYLPVFSAQAQAQLGYDNRPFLGGLRFDSTSWNGAGTVNADWTLISLARPSAIAATRKSAQAEEQSARDARRVAVGAAVELYVRALSTFSLIEDAELTLQRRTQQSQAIQGLSRAGLRPSVDATRAEVEAVAARYRLELRRVERSSALAALAAALGKNPEAVLIPSPPASDPFVGPQTAHAAVTLALSQRPDLQRFEAALAARQSELQAAILRRAPVLGISATGSISYVDLIGPGLGAQGRSYAGSGMAYLRWSGLDANVIRAADVARASVLEAQRALESALLDVRTQTIDAVYAVQRAKTELERAHELLAGARATREAQLERYKAGVASLLELLDAESLEQNARLSRIEAARDYDVARVRLLSACGGLEQLGK